MKTQRIYKFKDVPMVLGSHVVAQNFDDNLTDLSKAHSTWTKEFSTRLMNEVLSIQKEVVGTNTRFDLIQATANLNSILKPAMNDIVTFKKQCSVEFANEPEKLKTLLQNLGLEKNGKKLSKLTQSELIGMFLVYARNISKYGQDLVSKGIPSELLDRLNNCAQQAELANTLQEQLKTGTKVVNEEMISRLNALYTEIIGICKIASDYYKKDAVKKEMFTFSKIVKNMGIVGKQTEKEAQETSPTSAQI